MKEKELASSSLKTQLPLNNGKLGLRILIDRASVEVFGNGGEAVIPSCFLPDDTHRGVEFYATGAPATVVSMHVYPMRSAWH